LTCALYLLGEGHDVTIIGRHIPGDLDIEYTSPFAGANWHSFAADDDIETQKIDVIGYHKFMELATDPAAGVHIVPNVKYVRAEDVKDGKINIPWFAEKVQGFRLLEKGEYPDIENFIGGWRMDSVTISTTIYLHYLLNKCFQLGATLRRQDVKHVNEAFDHHHSKEKADLVINCTGLMARFLGGVEDEKLFPIRGQVLWARNNGTKQVSVKIKGYEGESLYMFPRKEGGCIIGGTFLKNNWGSLPDPEMTKRTVARAEKYIPELTDPKLGNPPHIEVFRENVGLRPAREGGVRIEREGQIIHNYGVGPAGYQSSFGIAEKVSALVKEYYREAKL
jgi:D-amino-acid oxidase